MAEKGAEGEGTIGEEGQVALLLLELGSSARERKREVRGQEMR